MADRCKSCHAAIEWSITAKGSRIPLDIGLHDDGSIVVDHDNVARVVPGSAPARRSHFQSCPNAGEHRRSKTKSRA